MKKGLMSHSVPAVSVPEGSLTGVEECAVGNNGDYFAVGRIEADGCLVRPWHEAR
jgi:hypothetical protein